MKKDTKKFVPHKTKVPKAKIIFCVPSNKLNTIDSLAKEYGLSRSEFFLQCVDYAIENMDGK